MWICIVGDQLFAFRFVCVVVRCVVCEERERGGVCFSGMCGKEGFASALNDLIGLTYGRNVGI